MMHPLQSMSLDSADLYSSQASVPRLLVKVEGLACAYELVEEDLRCAFERYGHISQIIVNERESAIIVFGSWAQVWSATNLDGTRVPGVGGTIRVTPLCETQNLSNLKTGLFQMPAYPGLQRDIPYIPNLLYGASGNGPDVQDQTHGRKLTCRIVIGIENDAAFSVSRKAIHQVARRIWQENPDVKTRIRGRGSGYKEGDFGEESSDPLQLCISAKDSVSYMNAIALAKKYLGNLHDEYHQYCKQNGLPEQKLEIVVENRPAVHRQHHEKDHRKSIARDNRAYCTQGINEPIYEDRPKGHQWTDPDRPQVIDRGDRPENAPTDEEIQLLIEKRNSARRVTNYKEADTYRDELRDRGVILMDYPGARGLGQNVTTWRYWQPRSSGRRRPKSKKTASAPQAQV